MSPVELVLLLTLVAALLGVVAERINVAYPIVMVLGGIALAFVPALPTVTLDPELVFTLFLPPILYSAAFLTAWDDFVSNLRPILLLAFGLVIATTAAVAFAAEALIGLPLAAGFVLGAIISPPDAIAATAIAHRLGLPHRIVVILEGESLINDAVGLVLLQVAVAAIVAGAHFSLGMAALDFLMVSVGGLAFGLAVGVVIRIVLARFTDPGTVTILSMLIPFAAYLPAEALGVSGVLATVAAGIYAGLTSPETMKPSTRLRAGFVWETVLYLMNGLVFVLIGLQLRTVLDEIGSLPISKLLIDAVSISLVVIAVRIVWVFVATYLPRFVLPGLNRRDPPPTFGQIAVVSWAGMRGIVSLAAALSLPVLTRGGDPFPERSLIIFHAFCVIVATLVVQGLTLPMLIRFFGVKGEVNDEEELEARRFAIEAALARLDEIGRSDGMSPYTVEQLRQRYIHRLRVLDAHDEEVGTEQAHDQLVAEMIAAERRILRELRRRSVIGDSVFRALERELDLRASQFE